MSHKTPMNAITYILKHDLVTKNAKKLKIPPPLCQDFCQDIYEIILSDPNKFDNILELGPEDFERYLYVTMRFNKNCAFNYKYLRYNILKNEQPVEDYLTKQQNNENYHEI